MTREEALNILDLPADASPTDIKRAWRNACRKGHPDRGGDSDQMARANRAYTVLSEQDNDAPTAEQLRAQQAVGALRGIFSAIIEEGHTDPVGETRDSLCMATTALCEAIGKAKLALRRLDMQAASIVYKGKEHSLLHDIIKTKREEQERLIKQHEELKLISQAVLQMLDDYEMAGEYKAKESFGSANTLHGVRTFSFENINDIIKGNWK